VTAKKNPLTITNLLHRRRRLHLPRPNLHRNSSVDATGIPEKGEMIEISAVPLPTAVAVAEIITIGIDPRRLPLIERGSIRGELVSVLRRHHLLIEIEDTPRLPDGRRLRLSDPGEMMEGTMGVVAVHVAVDLGREIEGLGMITPVGMMAIGEADLILMKNLMVVSLVAHLVAIKIGILAVVVKVICLEQGIQGRA
jgi:hypothetical protein